MIGVGCTPHASPGSVDGSTRAGKERRGSNSAPRGERDGWVALAAVPGIGPVGFRRLVERFGGALAALDRSAAELVQLLPRADAATSAALEHTARVGPERIAAEIAMAAARCGARVVTGLDTAYPQRLARLPAPPPVLYVSGSLDPLSGPCAAVVGTRRPTGYGRAMGREISDELARAGVCVVSGLALGIDGIAHRAALDCGGRTGAVLPSPLDRIYPPRHRELAAAIVAAGGVLLSEAPPGRMTGKPDFARRNRIVSGLADAVVIVEAPDRSGALLTAASALEQSRDLYALPGPIDSVASRGCNRLIADHQAELVTSAVALVQRLGLRPAGRSSLAVGLSEAEALVLGSLLKRSASIEELLGCTRLDTAPLASALTLLEARGLVTSYGGATFHPTLAARRAGSS